jgi:DNA modification methylase
VLPSLSKVDIVVTSPLYNQFHHNENGTGMFKGDKWLKKSANGYDDKMPEGDYQDLLRRVFDVCEKKTKGLMWINHKLRYRSKVGIHPARIFDYPIYAEIVWDRRVSMTQNANKFCPSHEYVYGFGTPHYWNKSFNHKMSVWQIAPHSDKVHPCVFPEKLIEPLILASCPLGGTVLDPFGGVFTTGIVSLKHGRKFIGIEKEKKYFDEGVKRITKLWERLSADRQDQDKAVIARIKKGMHYQEIANDLEFDKNRIYKIITGLVKAGKIKKVGAGEYLVK